MINTNVPLSSKKIILGKYIILRRIERRLICEVFLVEEGQGGPKWELKIINKKSLHNGKQSLIQRIKDKINLIKNIKHDHIVQLQDCQEDDDHFYVVLEYCDGDLMNLQAEETNRIFPLSRATEYLSQVIIGLKYLQKKGYLHGQIKPQNILIKNVNGFKTFKIRLDSFDSITKLTLAFILTDHLIAEEKNAPQLYLQTEDLQSYGVKPDVWGFGVMFFYMMNMDYPFKWMETIPGKKRKYEFLCQQAANFSYRKAVEKTKKKALQNCSNEVEDIFKKIFCIDPKRRISFSQIERHPIFALYIKKPQIQINPNSLLKNKLQDRYMQLMNKDQNNSTKVQIQKLMAPYAREEKIIRVEQQEIYFLLKIIDQFEMVNEYIDPISFLMFAFNLTKYNIFLLKNHYNSLKISKYQIKHPQLDWSNFFITQKFTNNKRKEAIIILNSEERYNQLYGECNKYYKEICKLNEYFASSFQNKFDIDENFFRSYRRSIKIIYGALKFHLKYQQLKKIYYCIFIVYIAQIFDKLHKNYQFKHSLFINFFSKEPILCSALRDKHISYCDIANYILRCDDFEIFKQAQQIIDVEMSK